MTWTEDLHQRLELCVFASREHLGVVVRPAADRHTDRYKYDGDRNSPDCQT